MQNKATNEIGRNIQGVGNLLTGLGIVVGLISIFLIQEFVIGLVLICSGYLSGVLYRGFAEVIYLLTQISQKLDGPITEEESATQKSDSAQSLPS